MTIEERNNKLKHLITCMKCEVSGKSCDENCPTQYDAGNMGEIIENLEAISKVLEQEDILDKIRAEIIKYEGNCRLAVDEYPSCKQCTDNVFKSIYGFFDKYRGESEEE